MVKYTVVRLDDIKSRHVGRNYSVRVPSGVTLENGCVAKVVDREANNLDVHEITTAASGDTVVLIVNPAIVYDNGGVGKGMEYEYFMKEGEVVRGYELSVHDLVSISLEGFITEPSDGEFIVPNGYKLDVAPSAPATGTYFKVVKKEAVGGALTVNATQTATVYAVLEVKQV